MGDIESKADNPEDNSSLNESSSEDADKMNGASSQLSSGDELPALPGQGGLSSTSSSNSHLQSTKTDEFIPSQSTEDERLGQTASLTNLPDLVLMKIVDFLTVKEKLESERISKRWQELVNASLRRQQTLSTDQIFEKTVILFDSGAPIPKFHPLDKIKLSLKLMSDPATKATDLRRLNLAGLMNPIGVAKKNISILDDFQFPKLEYLEVEPSGCLSEPLPAFVLRSKNLRSISGLCVDRPDLSRLLTELPQLKKLEIQVFVGDEIWEALEVDSEDSEDSDEERMSSRNVKTGLFKDVCCPLETLRINLLPADGIPNLVKACPGLKELHFTFDELESEGKYCDFRPLSDLHLRLLEFNHVKFGGEEPIAEIAAALSMPDTPLSRSLEKFMGFISYQRYSDLQILRSLTCCRNLRVLHFQAIDDRNPKSHNSVSVGSILQSQNFPHLQELSLFCIKLNGFGKGDIFDLPLLKELSVCPCDKHSDSVFAQFIAKVIRTCSSLEKLHLPGRSFKDGFFRALAKEVPEGCSSEIVVAFDRKRKCSRVTGDLEAKARRFGLNLKFSLPKNDCDCEQWID